MGVNVKEYMSGNLIFVKLFGCWSPKSPFKAKIYRIYTIITYITLATLVPLGSIINFFIKDGVDVLTIADSAYMVSELTAYMFRMAFWLKREKLIKQTFDTLSDPIFNKQGVDQDELLKKSATTALRVYQIFMACCTTALFAWASVPLFAKKRILPLEVWYPFNPLQNTIVYLFVYGHIFLTVAGATILNVSTGTVVSGLMIHAAGQLKILKKNLNDISDYTDKILCKLPEWREDLDKIIDSMIYPKIISCLQHHEKIVQFVKNIETCFGMYTFVQFMAGSSIICLTAVELTIISPATFKFYWMLIYMVCMLMELMLFCWFGTKLYYESIDLVDAVYLTNWYKYGPKSKKALFILMERSKNPLRVRAAKLFDLSLDTFTRIIRGAYSLFAVLQRIMNTDDF